MRRVICKYNPQRDAAEVISGLAVSIDDMLRTGIVHSGSAELESNDIDDPNLILGRVSDEFAAIDAMRAVRKYGKKSKAVEKEVAKATESVNPNPTE